MNRISGEKCVRMYLEKHADEGWWVIVTTWNGVNESKMWRRQFETLEQANDVLNEAWRRITGADEADPSGC